eukprot:CAMPEP_0169289058 /NCGR_PEP_ID=MMETSP1016-20121227/60917_1 /TAXON_ID=342587 /ORGANISM="Karlodinium micrum, Strain CCMP2283" /LENGTH=49 /DNA_ID= /DNA_START= /DNA_END= /DNA_ORIENTATION=
MADFWMKSSSANCAGWSGVFCVSRLMVPASRSTDLQQAAEHLPSTAAWL